MQYDVILLVGDRTQHLAFSAGGVGQHGQRLVAVGGNEQVVEAFRPAGRGAQFNMCGQPF